MHTPLVFRRVAQLELDEAVAWYENKRVGLGIEFRIEIEKYLERIANQPQRFRKVRGDVRRVVVQRFPYSIYFLPEANTIVVLAIFHVRRAPRNLEGRL
ncbi:MAG: type II toxin-antitoxin system RelE/ParE family toxin [Acidobacteriota bacterium]|nr:type II toxin-antitoxin system RelE/ParE family toxin [Acidobacteriota bacterium]